MVDGAGFGGDGAGFGGDGDAGGFLVAGAAMGAMSNLVPPTKGGVLAAAAVRAQLEEYRQLQADGLITQEDYDAVKARLLGLHGEGTVDGISPQ